LAGAVAAELPKPMAPIFDPSGDLSGDGSGERPFLEYVLDGLAGHGFGRVVVSVGHRAEAIVGHFGGSYAGMELRYCREDEPLGTGGAIAAALKMAEARDVFVLNGDTYATVEYAAMMRLHREQDALLSVALMRVPDTARYGAVEVRDGRVTGFQEKGVRGPGRINAGVYLMRREVMEGWALPERFSFEEEVLTRRLGEVRPTAFLASGYFIDIGVVADYELAQTELPRLFGRGSR